MTPLHVQPGWTNTTPGDLSLGTGDQVETYCRTTKDRPAWVGPTTVRHSDVDRNKVTVAWQNCSLEEPLNSSRRAMTFAAFQPGAHTYGSRGKAHPAIQLVRNALESIHTRSILI